MSYHLPQTNATLLLIAGGSARENYTRPAVQGKKKWEGEADAYVRNRIISGFNEAGELNRVQAVDLIIPSDLEPAVSVTAGDTVLFEQWNPVLQEMKQFEGRVQSFATPADLPSLPNELKIALERILAVP